MVPSKKHRRKWEETPETEQQQGSFPGFFEALDYHPLQGYAFADETSMDDFELEQLLNMIRLPLYLERFMIFTLLGSLDCFLYYFTVLPIKILLGLFTKKIRRQKMDEEDTSWLSRTYKERVTLFLMISTSILLGSLDTSQVYHRIKRQSAMKLYMLFNVLEITDKLLASMGQSLLGVLLSKKGHRHVRYKQLLLVTLSLVYLLCHTWVLIYQTIALNVAVNSYSNSLITLLLSLQFAEIKASVFKKFDKEGLFQITLADTAERFKMMILIVIIILRNLGTTGIKWDSLSLMKIAGPIIYIFGSEIIVDWMKHAYINKFNRIKPHIYDKFFYIMYRDHSTNLRSYQERIGLPLLSYVILAIVMLRSTLLQVLQCSSLPKALIALFGGFILLVILRFTCHTVLIYWGYKIQAAWDQEQRTTEVTEADYVPGLVVDGMGYMDLKARTIIHKPLPPDPTEARNNNDIKRPQSLDNVTRYKMISKRIW